MDMIAWNKSGILSLETNIEHKAQAELMARMTSSYTDLIPEINTPAWGSDHAPFVKENIAAILTIEDWSNHNPCYHRTCDTIDRVDFEFARDVIKVNLATILSL
jgi:hypothetical protein